MATYVNDNNEYYYGQNIIYDNKVIINPTEEMLLLAGYHIVPDIEPTQEELLEIARLNKLGDIDGYDLGPNVNLFYLGDVPMWLDSLTRLTLRISIESYLAMGISNVTKWFGGLEFTFPTNTWLLMLNALEVYAAEALNVTESHRAAILNLETIQEIEDYDITQGYPQKLNLTPQWLAQHV